MLNRRLLIHLLFLLVFIWGANNVRKAYSRLGFEPFNKKVLVEVIDLPFCGRSNIIEVGYKDKKHNISVNKNDCIEGRYQIGDTLEATYNTKLKELNPGNFVGVYRIAITFFVITLFVYVGYIYFQKSNER